MSCFVIFISLKVSSDLCDIKPSHKEEVRMSGWYGFELPLKSLGRLEIVSLVLLVKSFS